MSAVHFMGGKARTARRITAEMLRRRTTRTAYLEPFLGACNILPIMAPLYGTVLASDVQPDLAILWEQARDGWQPPETLSRDEYTALRHAEPSALRAFAGYGCSFGGKWFAGYVGERTGRDYCGEARRAVLRKARGLSGARITCSES